MNADQASRYFEVCNKWLFLKNKQISILSHPMLRDKNIAVYGLGKLGKRLTEEFENDHYRIAYAVDKRADMMFADFAIYPPNYLLPDSDIMIVTPFYEYEVLKGQLEGLFSGEILSLETIINELWTEGWTK